MTTSWAFQAAFSLMLLKVLSHTIWENACYHMVLVGHRAHGALKTLIFEKTFRMSSAANKDYSSGEIMSLIHRDSGRVWTFVWDLADLIEIPFEFFLSAYYLWINLGWSAFTGCILYAILWQVNKYKGKLHRHTWGVIDRKRDKRMLRTSEAFHHAKMLKLYGWEQKFEENVTQLYNDESGNCRFYNYI